MIASLPIVLINSDKLSNAINDADNANRFFITSIIQQIKKKNGYETDLGLSLIKNEIAILNDLPCYVLLGSPQLFGATRENGIVNALIQRRINIRLECSELNFKATYESVVRDLIKAFNATPVKRRSQHQHVVNPEVSVGYDGFAVIAFFVETNFKLKNI